MSKSTRLMVAAIQCGSSSFCYGFSLKNEWGRPFITNKAPACLLLKKDFTESLIAYKAEDKYSGLEDGNNDYHFFKRSLKAILVLEHFIRCIKKIVYQNIEAAFLGIHEDDIDYVFTVPTTGEKMLN